MPHEVQRELLWRDVQQIMGRPLHLTERLATALDTAIESRAGVIAQAAGWAAPRLAKGTAREDLLDGLADREAVDRAEVDRAAWSRRFAGAFSSALYFFAGDRAAGGRLYARMFAPGFGIEEDPATGAAATLAGSLANRLPEGEGVFAWTIDQGVKMGRPSLIEASAEKRGGRTVRVMAGGCTVLVAEGSITVPDGM